MFRHCCILCRKENIFRQQNQIYIDNRKNKQTKTFPQKQIKNKLHKEEDESKAFSIEPDRTSWIRTDKKKNTQFYFSTLITCRPYWDIQVIDSAHGNMWNCFFYWKLKKNLKHEVRTGLNQTFLSSHVFVYCT